MLTSSKYSRHGRCFVLPDFGLRPQVMIPPEHVKWLIEQPGTTLAATVPIAKALGLPYLVPTLDVQHNLYYMDVIRKGTTRNLGKLQPDIFSDLKGRIDRHFGSDQEQWRHVPLYETLQEILFETSSRVFLGSPLCYNKFFLRSLMVFFDILGLGTIVVGELLPLVLKPILGYLMAIPIYVTQVLALQYLVPEIKKRMANLRRQRGDPAFEWDQPKDMLMWLVIAALDRQDPQAEKPERIAQGLLFLVGPHFPCFPFSRAISNVSQQDVSRDTHVRNACGPCLPRYLELRAWIGLLPSFASRGGRGLRKRG